MSENQECQDFDTLLFNNTTFEQSSLFLAQPPEYGTWSAEKVDNPHGTASRHATDINRRNKLSHDPNNTAWSNSASNYGRKILSRQGWKPGDYLGAENANHSDHYTAANASHIRVLLREENLGLGAKVGKGSAETFGLSQFSGVLGRLNGKSDSEVQKQQNALRDAELRTYQAQKYGVMNFVSGGLLVGDQIQPAKRECVVDYERKPKKRKAEDRSIDGETNDRSKIKRRKAEGDDDNLKGLQEEYVSAEPSSRKKKERRRQRGGRISPAAGEISVESSDVKTKSKRRRKKELMDQPPKDSIAQEPMAEKSHQKEEKRARKEERRKRKEEKRRRLVEKQSSAVSKPDQQTHDAKNASKDNHQAANSRQAVRHRYIQQKRMASMDPQAMKEIFMLKAAA